MKLQEIAKTEEDESLEEGFGRSSNIYRDFFSDIANLSNVDKLVAEHATNRGHAFLLRGKDGNAYEIQIMPARYGDYFQDQRKAGQHQERQEKERLNK